MSKLTPLIKRLIAVRYKLAQTPFGKRLIYLPTVYRTQAKAGLGNLLGKQWSQVVPARKSEPKYELASFTRIFNEGQNIKEFVAFHLAVGVEHLYLYDNGSEDDTKEILQPFIDDGKVTLVDWPEKPISPKGDVHCFSTYGPDCKWIACLDADEFLFPVQGDDLREVLREFEGEAAVAACWQYFGSAGYQTRPEGLVIENYLRCTDRPVETVKPIVNPARALKFGNSHFWVYKGKQGVDENHHRVLGGTTLHPSANKLRINHYHSKSVEDYMKKIRPDYAVDVFGQVSQMRTKEAMERAVSRHNGDENRDILRFLDKTKAVMERYS